MRTCSLFLLLVFCCGTAGFSSGEVTVPYDDGGEAAQLLERLRHEDRRTRQLTVLRIQEAHGREVVDELFNMAENDRYENIRSYAVRALGYGRDPRIFPFLLNLVSNRSDRIRVPFSVGCEACAALGRTGDPRAYSILLPLLEEEDPRLISMAAIGLGQLGEKAAFDRLAGLLSGGVAYPEYVASALVSLDEDKGLALLCDALRQGPDQEVLRAIVEELKRNPHDYVRKAMLENLETDDRNLWYDSLRVLAKAGDKACTSELLRFFAERGYSFVLTALGEIGDPRAVPVLVAELKTENRQLAAKALGLIGGDVKIAAALVEALADQSRLSKSRKQELEDRNVELSADWSAVSATICMIEALGRLGRPETISALVPYLDDPRIIEGHTPSGCIRLPYPCNMRVNRVALWAINSILAGHAKAGIPRSSDPVRPPPLVCPPVSPRLGTDSPRFASVAAAGEWWEQVNNDKRYQFQKGYNQ